MKANIISVESIHAYLIENFVTLDQLALASNSTPEEIHGLVANGCAPQESYLVSSSIQISSRLSAQTEYETRDQAFYSASVIPWIQKCQRRNEGNQTTLARWLYEEFEADFFASLVARNAQDFGFAELYKDKKLNCARARPVAARAWESLLKGIYGICVRGHVSADAIVRKGIAVNRVALLTDNGSRLEMPAPLRPVLIAALREFDSIVSQFAPHDWPASSRKRLFDDLIPRFGLETEFPDFRVQPGAGP